MPSTIGFPVQGLLARSQNLSQLRRVRRNRFGNEDVTKACFNFGNGDGDSFTVDCDFVFRFHGVFRLMPDSRAGCGLGVLEFENVSDGGRIPRLAVAGRNPTAVQTTTNPSEGLNASGSYFLNNRKHLGC